MHGRKVAITMTAKLYTLQPSARRQAAALLRRTRASLGLTQAEAAKLAGVSERSYRDMELGRVRMAALEAYCVLVGCGGLERAA